MGRASQEQRGKSQSGVTGRDPVKRTITKRNVARPEKNNPTNLTKRLYPRELRLPDFKATAKRTVATAVKEVSWQVLSSVKTVRLGQERLD